MDFESIGVIPLNTSKAKFLALSMSKMVAIGIDHSVYIFDTSIGENIGRVNHFPHQVSCGVWHNEDLTLVTGDDYGDIIVTKLKYMTSNLYHLPYNLLYLSFHICSENLLVLTSEKFVVWDFKTFEIKKEMELTGFKVFSDFLCPQKVILLNKKKIVVVRKFLKIPAICEGKVDDVVDAVINPSIINTIYVLTTTQLLEYDIVMPN